MKVYVTHPNGVYFLACLQDQAGRWWYAPIRTTFYTYLNWFSDGGEVPIVSFVVKEIKDERILSPIRRNWWRFVSPCESHAKINNRSDCVSIRVSHEWAVMFLKSAISLF